MRHLILLLLFISTFACNTRENIPAVTPDSPHTVSIPAPSENLQQSSAANDLLDSIANELPISIQQMKAATTLDSFHYTRSENVQFLGEQLLPVNTTYMIAIISWSDGLNCLNKYLFTFNRNTKKSNAFQEIATNCDRDGSSNYSRKNYKFTSDTSFETTSTWYPPEEKEKTEPVRKEVSKYSITSDGRIVELR